MKLSMSCSVGNAKFLMAFPFLSSYNVNEVDLKNESKLHLLPQHFDLASILVVYWQCTNSVLIVYW